MGWLSARAAKQHSIPCLQSDTQPSITSLCVLVTGHSCPARAPSYNVDASDLIRLVYDPRLLCLTDVMLMTDDRQIKEFGCKGGAIGRAQRREEATAQIFHVQS